MSLFDAEAKNFYRASILVFKHGSDALRKVVERYCGKTWTSFPEFLLRHRHAIFHMIHRDGCCQCTSAKPRFYPGYLLTVHFYDLYHLLGPQYECPQISGSSFKLCSCNNTVKANIQPRSLDIIVLTTLILNIEEFKFDKEVTRAIQDLRRLRNEVLALGRTGKMADNEYRVFTSHVKQAIGTVASTVSEHYYEQMSQQMTYLLHKEIHLYTLIDVITVMKNAIEREIKLLTDLKYLSDLLYEGRQGELLSMREYAAEQVSAVFGPTDPLLKELQDIKFLLVDEKYSDVIKKMDGRMNGVYKKQKQTQAKLEILYTKLWIMDSKATATDSELQLVPSGENLELSEDGRSIYWKQVYSGGLVFSHRPIAKLEVMTVRMSGSGNVAVAIIQSDPEVASGNLGKLLYENKLTIGVNVKLYKSKRDVILRFGGDIDDDKVFLESEHERYTLHKEAGKSTWLALYIRFGDVRVELVPDKGHVLRFGDAMGYNVQFVEGSKRVVTLKEENANAICRMSRRIFCGEEVTLYVKPLRNKDDLSKIYSLDVGITMEGLYNGSLHDENPFTSALRSWASKVHFNEQNCLGKLHIAVSPSGLVSVTNAKGLCGNAHLSSTERRYGVAIIMQLYRCNIEIAAYKIRA